MTSVAVVVPPVFVAPIVTFEAPVAVGVPVMVPVVVLIDKPTGRPVAEYAVGVFVATIWYVNCTSFVALAVNALVIAGTATAVITKEAVPVPAKFLAPIVTVVTPVTVGVPEIAPVAAFKESPAGKFVAVYSLGPFDATIWYVKAVPTAASAVKLLVITGNTGVVVITL